jgi:hypothetical protein
MFTPRHPQVTVQYADQPIQVDVDLATVLPLIWQLGARTLFSCQASSNPQYLGRVMLGFDGEASLRLFFEAILANATPLQSVHLHRHWFVECWFLDNNLGLDRPTGQYRQEGPPHLHFGVKLFFPREDLPLLEHLLTGPPPDRPA